MRGPQSSARVSAMPYYRLFIHDAMGQVCEPARIIEAASDAEGREAKGK